MNNATSAVGEGLMKKLFRIMTGVGEGAVLTFCCPSSQCFWQSAGTVSLISQPSTGETATVLAADTSLIASACFGQAEADTANCVKTTVTRQTKLTSERVVRFIFW